MKNPKNVEAIIGWYRRNSPANADTFEELVESAKTNSKAEVLLTLALQGFEAGREFERQFPHIVSGFGYLNMDEPVTTPVDAVANKILPVIVDEDVIDTPCVQIQYHRKDKQITAYDKVDRNNEPALYTKTKRGLDKVWAILKEMHAAFPDTLDHRNVMTTLSANGVKYHYWCRMD